MSDEPQTLVSVMYDGTVIMTEPTASGGNSRARYEAKRHAAPRDDKAARLHRWKVRAYLYLNGQNRLPPVSDYQEDA